MAELARPLMDNAMRKKAGGNIAKKGGLYSLGRRQVCTRGR